MLHLFVKNERDRSIYGSLFHNRAILLQQKCLTFEDHVRLITSFLLVPEWVEVDTN